MKEIVNALFLALLLALAAAPATAQGIASRQPIAPCGACLVLSLTPAQAQVVSDTGPRLAGLTIVVTAQPASLESAVAAVGRLREQGSDAGLILQDPAVGLTVAGAAVASLVVLDLTSVPMLDERTAFDVKTRATALRAATVRRLGLRLMRNQRAAAAGLGLAPYFDFVVLPEDAPAGTHDALEGLERWTSADAQAADDIASVLDLASAAPAARVLLPIAPGHEGLVPVLAALAAAVPPGLTRLNEVGVECEEACEADVFLDAATLDAVAVVRPSGAVSRLRIRPTATRIQVILPDSAALAGARGVEPIWQWQADGAELLLPAVSHPFVVRARGWQGPAETGFATGVEVAGQRTLRVEEIIARHQAADAAAKAVVRTLVSTGQTVLTFEAPGFAAPLAITARTTVFTSPAGTDVAQREIRVNGLALDTKGDELPRLPLIEPERVTTPPLAIALTEAYTYRLEGQETLSSHRCHVVAFRPRRNDRTLFSGRAWIDVETFGIARLDASQTGLPGPVVTSREIHDFDRATEQGVAVWLPSHSEVHQSYETASFTTPIHRVVSFERHLVNAPDFATRLDAAHGSDAVMMRDTPRGYRYLRRERAAGSGTRAAGTGTRTAGPRVLIPDRVQRVRTIAGGVTIDPNISVPLVFAGISYVNFDVLGTGAQIDGFFGGTYGRLAWSSPPIGRSGWRASGDAFGIAVSYNDRAFSRGVEQYRENVAQRPLHLSAGLVGPLAAGVRLRASYELDYTWYSRSSSTSPAFVVPASTPVHGLRVGLERQRGAWTLGGWWNRAWRQRWTAWGVPGQTGPPVGVFDRYAFRAARSIVWTPRVVGRVEAQWMGGRALDRFSRYAFGTFDNPLRGYPSASIRYDRGLVVRSALSWSAASHLRVDAFADGAAVRDPGLSTHAKAFPGVGAALEAPLPFSLLTSLEWGYGFQGVNTNGTRGTHVVRISVYKAF